MDNANTNISSFNKQLDIGNIESAERLTSQIIGHIEELKAKGAKQQRCKVLALKELARWQTDELHKLRQGFEG